LSGSDNGERFTAFTICPSRWASHRGIGGGRAVEHNGRALCEAGKLCKARRSVKYRGIFINDEAPAPHRTGAGKFGGYNHKFYTNVFELLLRLKANYLWPAMWNNCFSEDDTLNPKLADEYGHRDGDIHVEPMSARTRSGTGRATRRAVEFRETPE